MSNPKSTPPTRSRRKLIRNCLVAILLGYCGFCGYFYFAQERHLLEPNADPTGMRASSLQEENLTLTDSGNESGEAISIHYRKYVAVSNPTKGSVFYLHGNKGNMDKCEWEIEFLINLGYDVWTMDYRGYGESTGEISEQALRQDALAVYEKMLASAKSKPIIIWGRSFGSGVAATVAASASSKPQKLVLETPYWSLVDATRQKCFILPPFLFRYELPTHEFLLSVNCPICFIHGTQDEKIPFNSSERLLVLCEENSCKAELHSIQGGLHNLREPSTNSEFERIAAMILD